jgi:hypothetical protein
MRATLLALALLSPIPAHAAPLLFDNREAWGIAVGATARTFERPDSYTATSDYNEADYGGVTFAGDYGRMSPNTSGPAGAYWFWAHVLAGFSISDSVKGIGFDTGASAGPIDSQDWQPVTLRVFFNLPDDQIEAAVIPPGGGFFGVLWDDAVTHGIGLLVDCQSCQDNGDWFGIDVSNLAVSPHTPSVAAFSTVQSVPEPSSLSLLWVSLLGLAALRRTLSP